MTKYEGFLLCTDFDGTFALPNAQLSEENLKAVRFFQENGGLFTIASGRTPAFIREFQALFRPNAPLIAMNGTLICNENDYSTLKTYPLGREILPVLDELSETGLVGRILLLNDQADRRPWDGRTESVPPSEFFGDLPGVWHKVILVQSPGNTLALRDLFAARFSDRFSYGRSWPEGLEIHASGSGKGECLRWIRARLGDRVRVTVGVGDYENDLSLVRDADIGYAVGNALDSVKEAADRVTVPHTGHAIARIIEELIP